MSEPYRAAPTPPLVWTVKGAVLAVDPATGDLRWRHSVDGLVKRLFAVGRRRISGGAAPAHLVAAVNALQLDGGRIHLRVDGILHGRRRAMHHLR